MTGRGFLTIFGAPGREVELFSVRQLRYTLAVPNVPDQRGVNAP